MGAHILTLSMVKIYYYLPYLGIITECKYPNIVTRTHAKYEKYVMTSNYIIKYFIKKYVIKYEKYIMISKKVWKVCYDIKKVWNNVKMHVKMQKYVKYVTMLKYMS